MGRREPLVAKRRVRKVPRIMKLRSVRSVLLGLLVGSSALSIPVAIGAATEGCTPAQSAQIGTLGQLVLSDVEAGKTLPQIETDVAEALFGVSTITPAVVAIANNILQLLLNLAETPPATNSPAAPANLTVSPAALAAMKSMVVELQRQMTANAPKG
jgi:hypothetical protein